MPPRRRNKTLRQHLARSARRGAWGMRMVTPAGARLVLIATILIGLVLTLQLVYHASQGYEHATEQGKITAERITRTQADHVEMTLLSIDLTLRRAVERQSINELFGNNLAEYMLSSLQNWTDETPQIAAMLVVDERGEGTVGVHKKGYEGWLDYENTNFVTQPIFLSMREAPDNALVIARLPRKAGAGRDLILLARRLTKVNGDFGGIIIGALDPFYFKRFFESIYGKTSRHLVVVHQDGTVLSSTQATPDAGLLASLRKLASARSEAANRTQPTPVTDQIVENDAIHIFAAQQLQGFPALVSVTMDESDFLCDWRADTWRDFGFLAAFIVISSLFCAFLMIVTRQVARVQASEEAAVLASQAKSDFLANMSHELRTPLNAIIGFSEMINAGYFGPLNQKQKERITDINLCGSHLLQLISDILEFSKGEAGKLELHEEVFSLAEIVEETQRMMREKFTSKHIKLMIDVSEQVPAIRADRRKMRQVLLNLLSNAHKFTNDGGMVKISLRQDDARNIQLTVTDNGVGIAEEDMAKALSVFGQVDRNKMHEGTGLGLPLCKMFAELHGGKLELGSRLGEGTTVRITLPASRIAPRGSSSTASNGIHAAHPPERRTVRTSDTPPATTMPPPTAPDGEARKLA